jgi:hypothetical protein
MEISKNKKGCKVCKRRVSVATNYIFCKIKRRYIFFIRGDSDGCKEYEGIIQQTISKGTCSNR